MLTRASWRSSEVSYPMHVLEHVAGVVLLGEIVLALVAGKGIDRGDVEQCVGEIANQDCGTSLESLQTWVACQMDDLCLG